MIPNKGDGRLIIGICGKSGSGKSTVCNELKNLGAFVIDADKTAGEIMKGEVLEKVKNNFPHCFEEGVLNRKKLGAEVFSNPDKLELLNSIAHPAIKKEIMRQIDANKHKYEFIIVDAAVLLEADMKDIFGFTVCVGAPEYLRAQRISERDGISFDDAKMRLSSQKDDSFYINNTDMYIESNNENPPEHLAMQILERSRKFDSQTIRDF